MKTEIPLEENNFLNIDILGSWMEVGMLVAAVIVGLMVVFSASSKILKKRSRVFCPESSSYRRTHSRIHELLTEIRVKLNADRAAIIQFHNGGEFTDGTSMKKMSLTHESCQLGVSETFECRKDVLISSFVEMLDMLSNNRGASIEATSNLVDCHFKRHMESNHTLVFSIYPIKGLKSLVTSGALLVEWCNWDRVDMIDDDSVSINVPETVRYIEGQLINNR